MIIAIHLCILYMDNGGCFLFLLAQTKIFVKVVGEEDACIYM